MLHVGIFPVLDLCALLNDWSVIGEIGGVSFWLWGYVVSLFSVGVLCLLVASLPTLLFCGLIPSAESGDWLWIILFYFSFLSSYVIVSERKSSGFDFLVPSVYKWDLIVVRVDVCYQFLCFNCLMWWLLWIEFVSSNCKNNLMSSYLAVFCVLIHIHLIFCIVNLNHIIIARGVNWNLLMQKSWF